MSLMEEIAAGVFSVGQAGRNEAVALAPSVRGHANCVCRIDNVSEPLPGGDGAADCQRWPRGLREVSALVLCAVGAAAAALGSVAVLAWAFGFCVLSMLGDSAVMTAALGGVLMLAGGAVFLGGARSWRDLPPADEASSTHVVDMRKMKERLGEIKAGLDRCVSDRTAELEVANKEMESFVFSVSHDLRAPLRRASGFCGVLLARYAEDLGEDGKHLVNVVVEEVESMGQLIDDLLRFSRVGRDEMHVAETDMTDLARTAYRRLADANAAIAFSLEELPSARGDRALLAQVWANLLDNAVKFSRRQEIPVIHVGGHGADGWNTYYVRDNGAGFDSQYAHKLFGVFQRLHGQGEFEGTGVGLALVHRIVNRHGGKVWAEGEVGRGATFYFALPQR